jgi:two-component system OmpR family response regulator
MKKKILIIDDEYDSCLLLKTYLVSKNFDVDMAYTLNEGLKKLGNSHPDILFLDNNLPDGFGWEKAPQISVDYPFMKINLISAFQPANSLLSKINKNLRIIDKPLSAKEIDKSLV